MAAFVLLFSVATAHAEVASIYGGSDGLCGHKTASGERLNCAAMTAAHRRLPFGTQIRVCHSGCVTVRINDRGPWVRGRDIDLSPAAARATGYTKRGTSQCLQVCENQRQCGWERTSEFPLSEAKRTSRQLREMSAFDPKRTSRTRQSSRHGAAHRDSIIGSAWFQERSPLAGIRSAPTDDITRLRPV
jgi:rare lipoprotein A